MTIVLNGTTGITTPGTDSTTLVVNSNNFSNVNGNWRNRIINGAMVIDQRNAGAAVTTDGAFPVDRWKQNMSGGGVISGQRSTVAPAGFVNSLSQTVSTADSSIAAGDYYYLTQNIEGFNVADLGWGTASAQSITVSFQVRSSVTGTYAVAFGNSAFNRLYVATYTINAANTWETKTVTIAGDTSGTWLTDNGIGLRVYFDLGSGSAYNASSSGAWLGAGVGIRLSSTVNWIATSGATFYITGVQLEAGSVASPFERRDYGRELMMCQRYYVKLGTDGASFASWGNGVANASNSVQGCVVRLPVTMRTQPSVDFSTIRVYDGLGAAAISSLSSVTALSNSNAIGFDASLGSSTLTAGKPVTVQANNSTSGYIAASAEL